MGVLRTYGKIADNEYVNEWREFGPYLAHKYSVLGTGSVVYEVYEAYAGHSTLTHHNGVCVGSITTRPLPASMEALKPGSDERIRVVRMWFANAKEEARGIAFAAFPEDFVDGQYIEEN